MIVSRILLYLYIYQWNLVSGLELYLVSMWVTFGFKFDMKYRWGEMKVGNIRVLLYIWGFRNGIGLGQGVECGRWPI